jgi:hypothetical protein
VLISASDPMVVGLSLAAIDCALCGRPRAAWWLMVLISLGRPEAWLVADLYALWAWRSIPSMRAQLAAGLVLIPLLWFGVPAIAADTWFISGKVALDTTRGISGDRLSAMISGFTGLYELPMQLAALFGLAVAAARRDRPSLVMAGAAIVWLATEAGFALHGWNPSFRYMFAPAAVLIVLAGAGIGHVLARTSGHLVLRWATVAGIAALIVTLAPHARIRGRLAHNGIVIGHHWARQLDRLHAAIDRDGGAKRILACGQPVSYYGFQSILAWDMDQNIADVGWDPPTWIKRGQPIVFFEPVGLGWKVVPIHTTRPDCDRLAIETAFS